MAVLPQDHRRANHPLGEVVVERALRIMKSLRESGQDAVGLLGIIGWHYRQMFKKSGNKKGFKKIFEALHETDVDLKTSGKPESLILERLLFSLIRKKPY